MEELLRAILILGHADVATESAACAAVARVRWPGGPPPCPRCRRAMQRDLAWWSCTNVADHPRKRVVRFTVFTDTPLGTKRKPRVRAILLGIRSFATSARGTAARELARFVGMPGSTLWRHLHTLRAVLPAAPATPSRVASVTKICGRSTTARPAWARVGAVHAMEHLGEAARGGRIERLLGESVRTWINGTFHGVSARWLQRYLDEAASRARFHDALAEDLLEAIVDGGPPLTFARVRPR